MAPDCGIRQHPFLVLLVDHDAETRAAHGAALREAGLRVDEASSSAEALSKAPSLRPDIVVLDRDLPDGDGWEVARKLKRAPPLREVPILGLAAMGPRSDVEGALVAGCDVFLERPCAPDALVRYVLGMVGVDVEPPASSVARLTAAVTLPSAASTALPPR